MTSDTVPTYVVEARGLGKTYRLGERERLGGSMTKRLRGIAPEAPLRALHDVSFTVGRGECFGLVGTNGSGKSTLLQILARTVVPTEGSMTVRGRVLPMLSIGAGFHAELTGRENIVLQGAILGVPRRTVIERIDAILEFAELERHADTPLKRYSSGMQSRLSFAIGVRFPSDIFIFDEVLAVIDGEFRHRCLGEIEQMGARGLTVLFVSHDLEQSKRLCTRAMWLERGKAELVGPIDTVIAAYHQRHPGRAVGRLR